MLALLLAAEIIARTIAGEVGPLGPNAAILVVSTMAARVQDGRFGTTLTEVVEAGYFADAPATADSMAVAWALVTGRVPAVGLLWAYSDDDARRMGWPQGDVILRQQGQELHLARQAPGQ